MLEVPPLSDRRGRANMPARLCVCPQVPAGTGWVRWCLPPLHGPSLPAGNRGRCASCSVRPPGIADRRSDPVFVCVSAACALAGLLSAAAVLSALPAALQLFHLPPACCSCSAVFPAPLCSPACRGAAARVRAGAERCHCARPHRSVVVDGRDSGDAAGGLTGQGAVAAAVAAQPRSLRRLRRLRR